MLDVIYLDTKKLFSFIYLAVSSQISTTNKCPVLSTFSKFCPFHHWYLVSNRHSRNEVEKKAVPSDHNCEGIQFLSLSLVNDKTKFT